ncbi:MAG: leucine--tRNA ligase, partial [Candidatus Eisenbacteria bacterium]|nr:leucine--tRNA ligase [Candidatus Eisenbacteria bacterium]
SENYAMKVGTHPMRLIPNNVANFRRQLRQMGLMVDWSREVSTTEPNYYRWTQWIFLKLYERGLAYRGKAPVNWCPKCATVIADEQVIDGMCERHPDTRVEKKVMEQWFFRITDYAQELLDHLGWIDWSDIVRRAQINWIGRSEGALLRFPVEPDPSSGGAADGPIEVFTTRPDTVFGATYMVLAPEHPRVDALVTPEKRAEVEAYREATRRKDSIERMDLSREKTGVWIGAHAINPATSQPIPIWISDYVLMGYGTGAIMAVPAHDERDHEFARKFALPIVEVLERPADAPPEGAFTSAGKMQRSGPFDGLESEAAKAKITAWLGERGLGEPRVQFRLRDWCISRQRYWGPPIPMIHCDVCGIVPVPESDLPVLLPELEDFRPEGSGQSPLARVEAFHRVACPKCGGAARRDTDVSDNFLDSAWYFLRYPSANDDQHAWDPERTKRWFPVDSYIGGREHSVLHLMYTRFLCLAFRDMGLLPPDPEFKGEPFKRFRAHGLLIKDGDKMSKSRGNVVIPDRYVEEYGADTFRMFLMFLGPYELGGDFRDSGIVGIRRFLERVHRWCTEELPGYPEGPLPREAEVKLHQTIKKVTVDLETLGYNTAIAALMECHNQIRPAAVRNRFAAESFVVMLSPFAPHLAEELWASLGNAPTVEDAAWPVFDPALTVEETVEIAVQVNGKMRDAIAVSRDAEEAEVREAALAREKVRSQTAGKELRKVIYVKNRLINLIVG